MKEDVVSFCKAHNILLPSHTADNFRRVEPGVYTHLQLAFGPMIDGITDGVVAYMTRPVLEVHLDNLEFVPAPKDTVSYPTDDIDPLDKGARAPRAARPARVPRAPKHNPLNDIL